VTSADSGEASLPPSAWLLTREFLLRFTGAVLQILATFEVIRALSPSVAGIYFEGFILAYGLAALLRGKYEMYTAHYIVGRNAAAVGISDWTLTCVFARRTLIRGAISCGVLLVLTADLDIQEPQTRPYLETFLPFVLAVPAAALALFTAAALRAANRSLGSILVSAYALNVVLIVAAQFAPEDDALLTLSWAFLAGSLLAAGIGWWIVRRVLRGPEASGNPRPDAWGEVFAGVGSHQLNGLALAALQWGPLGVLALVGPSVDIAEFAVAARTAQIVEIMFPGMLFVPGGLLFQPLLMSGVRRTRLRLLANTGASIAAASTWVAALLVVAPTLFHEYGGPYVSLGGLFTILLAMQWVSCAGRPSIRYLTAHWSPERIRTALGLSAGVAILICVLGAPLYGSYGAAVAALLGALMLNGQAIVGAARIARSVS